MAINNNHWKPPFTRFPSWLCPTCQSGTLVTNKDSLVCTETGPSLSAKEHDAWDPDWIVERFSALLVCQNSSCGELVAIGGRTEHQETFSQELENLTWEPYYDPQFISPAPPIFSIPMECPEAVSNELRKAFSLYWSDKGSCANRLRVAAEKFLTERGIPRTRISKKRKRVPIPLHSRIEQFKNLDADSAAHLLAIKWLGNTGSHEALDDLHEDDLLNGFSLFEDVIEKIYVKHQQKLQKIAKRITSRKGRPLKRKRSSFF